MTKRQLEVLRIMRDEDEELVYERGDAWVGLTKIAARTAFAFFRSMTVSARSGGPGEMERYYINESGKRVLQEAGL